MEIIRSIRKMQARSKELTKNAQSIGLVPTMGFLHDGHLALIRKAKKLAGTVITSIFVNPTQFAPNEDFRRYPRDEKGDIAKIGSAGGDIVFIPRIEDIYPPEYETFVNVEGLSQTLEGKSRPGHFRGVTTVVAKLFNLTRPDFAVFGQKDYQQATVLKRMAADLDYPIRIIILPTVREKDGLAMSSRNKYFSPQQRIEAVCLYKALTVARQMVKDDRIETVPVIAGKMKRVIKLVCPVAQVDYIAFTDFDTLKPVRVVDKNTICSLAVRLYGVRLIDNMKME